MWPVTLDTIAVGAEQLQVLDVVLATRTLRDDMVNFQDAEGELAAAPVAPALLLAEQDVLVLAVGHRRVDVGAPGDVCAGSYQPVVEQVAHGLLQTYVDQLHGLGRNVDTDPAPVQVLGCHAGGGAAAEWVQYDVALIRRRLDDALQKRERFLGGVADALSRLRLNRLDVIPYRIHRHALHLVQITLLAGQAG